jgi:hypothetical protein
VKFLLRHSIVLALAGFATFHPAPGQLRLTGQASPAFLKSEPGNSQYVIDAGRATFGWRLDLFADAGIGDHIFFLGNVRMLQDQVVHLDLLAVKITDLASTGLNLEAGEIDLPFGNLGERRFPKTNPFYGLPLLHEHLTSLRSSNYRLWSQDSRYTAAGDGVRILDQGLYDLGVKLYGDLGMFDYWVALTNGTVSATSTYSAGYGSSGLNTKPGLGTIVRLAATPLTGLTIGSSYATGPFLREDGVTIYGIDGSLYDASDIQQHAIEGDIDFSFEHAAIYAEAVYNVWTFGDVLGSDLKAFGYSAEARYTLVPRVTIAARAAELFFNDLLVVPVPFGRPYYGRWDHDMLRLEGALGYRLDRAALVKLVYESNTSIGVTEDPPDNTFILQAVVSF